MENSYLKPKLRGRSENFVSKRPLERSESLSRFLDPCGHLFKHVQGLMNALAGCSPQTRDAIKWPLSLQCDTAYSISWRRKISWLMRFKGDLT
jgi:hypothetical protein